MDVWDVIVAAASGELVRTRKSSRERATSVSSDFSLHTVAPSQQDRAENRPLRAMESERRSSTGIRAKVSTTTHGICITTTRYVNEGYTRFYAPKRWRKPYAYTHAQK